MKSFSYNTQGVCSTNISFELDEGKLHNLQFTGGCVGNLKAIAKLVEGRSERGLLVRISWQKPLIKL